MATILPFLRQPHRYQSVQPPQWPFASNLDSMQAQGLIAHFPFFPFWNPAYDLSGVEHALSGGPWKTGTTSTVDYAIPGTSLNVPRQTSGVFWRHTAVSASLRNAFSDPTLKDGCSISAWHYVLNGLGSDCIVSLSGTDDLNLYPAEASNTARVFWRDTGGNVGSPSIATPDSTVGHLLLTTEPTSGGSATFNIYVNGKLDVSPTKTVTSAGPFSELDIANFAGGQTFSQPFWDIRFYNRTITEGEVAQHYSPATRWDAYHELGRVFYSIPAAAAAGGIRNPMGGPTTLRNPLGMQ